MIRFHLKCDQDHSFESWFQSGAAFDKLLAAQMINCPECGATKVSKSIMAPAVSSLPDTAENTALAKFRDAVESQADYVGDQFAKEARDMHDGRKAARPIYGQAKLEDARKLAEDGLPVMPLPFIPRKKTN